MARRRIIALSAFAVGMGLMVAPEGYSSETYRWVFAAFPPRLWGAAYLLVGLVAWSRRFPGMWVKVVVAGRYSSWTLGLLAATITGDAAAPTAFVLPATVAVLTVHSATEGTGS